MKKVVKSYNLIIVILLALAIVFSIIPYSINKYYNIEMGKQGYEKTDIHNIQSNILNSSTLGMIFFITICLLFAWMIVKILWSKFNKKNIFTNSVLFNCVCICCSFFGVLSSILAFIQVENKEYIGYFGTDFSSCNYHLVAYTDFGRVALVGLITTCIILVIYSFMSLLLNSSRE